MIVIMIIIKELFCILLIIKFVFYNLREIIKILLVYRCFLLFNFIDILVNIMYKKYIIKC